MVSIRSYDTIPRAITAKGILISYISTPKTLQRLPPIPSKLRSKINLVEIPLPQVEGLPENLVQKIVPDLILFDFTPYWIPDIGTKFGVPTVFFSVYTVAAMAFIEPSEELKTGNRRPSPEHFTMPPDWISFPSLITSRPDYATRMWTSLNFPDASGMSSGMIKSIEESSFVAFRSCDGEYLSVVRKLYQKRVLPIGVLPPVPEENKKGSEVNSNWFDAFKWLDGQKDESVVFVGFGSEYKMPIQQIHELAFGIELSRLPFVWILRKPQEVNSSDLLPPGFANRTLSQGIVIQGWVPQLEFPAHSAVGGCLFQSGRGTIVVSLGLGHPLILLPMTADQGFNAKLFVEKEVGYEVTRNEDGSFSRETVASSIRLVAVAPEGQRLRSKAAE